MLPHDATRDTGNLLLDRLPDPDLDYLRPRLERVAVGLKDDLFPPDAAPGHVAFPVSGVYSLAIPAGDGRTADATDVGREGLIAVTSGFAAGFDPGVRVTVRVRGECLRLPADEFAAAVAERPAVARVIQRYVALCWRGGLQRIVCARLHPVESRLPFLILRTRDRVGADEFELTQLALAEMLGASRQTVTVVAGDLQRGGAITYRRGVVRVADRGRLEQASCPCYGIMRQLAAAAAANGQSR